MIVDSGEISIETANDLDATTEGTVTADIAIDTTVANLATLEGTNAYTIKIADSDATGSTAEQLLAIDNATTVTVDASAITSIEGTFEEITALYGSSGISDLGDENIIIDGDLTVGEANIIDALTEGTVSGTISSTERVSSLTGLTGNNAYQITISEEDATTTSVSDLNNIVGLTSLAIDASAITTLAFENITDIKNILKAGNDRAQFSSGSFSQLTEVSIFNPVGYLENNPDLVPFFGSNLVAATAHYINNGFSEGRGDGSKDLADLNEVITLANVATDSTITVDEIAPGSNLNPQSQREMSTKVIKQKNSQKS